MKKAIKLSKVTIAISILSLMMLIQNCRKEYVYFDHCYDEKYSEMGLPYFSERVLSDTDSNIISISFLTTNKTFLIETFYECNSAIGERLECDTTLIKYKNGIPVEVNYAFLKIEGTYEDIVVEDYVDAGWLITHAGGSSTGNTDRVHNYMLRLSGEATLKINNSTDFINTGKTMYCSYTLNCMVEKIMLNDLPWERFYLEEEFSIEIPIGENGRYTFTI